MPQNVIGNFSPHRLEMITSNIVGFDAQFGKHNWKVVGHLPILDDIGNHVIVRQAVKILVTHIRECKPTHIFVSANPVFHGLIYQAIATFSELQVPRILWDAKRNVWWIAPAPFSRQERADMEIRTIDIPPELHEWVNEL